MPTKSWCEICGWEEVFENHGEAKQAQINHVHGAAFRQDISQEEAAEFS